MSISPLALKAKKVIESAWLHGPSYDLASQAAFALESAQLLQSPETAAELELLRARVAVLEVAVEAPELCADCGHMEDAHSKHGETDCTASDARVTRCRCSYFIPRYGAAELVIAPVQTLPLEDPHDSPLHRAYKVAHDLPPIGGASC